MVSRYALISGLGTLYLLPIEIRTRIYKSYFADRIITLRGETYCVAYNRRLLLTSKAVCEEASPEEKAPGLTLKIEGFPFWPPSPSVRLATTTIDITHLLNYNDRSPLWLKGGDFPALKMIRDASDLEFSVRSVATNGSIDDAFKGKLDSPLISFVRNFRRWCQHDRLLEWDNPPPNVVFRVRWSVSFGVGNSESFKRIATEIEVQGGEWKVVSRTGAEGTFSITTDEHGNPTYS